MGAEMQDHLWRMLERFVVWIFLKTFVCSVEFLFYNSISAWSFFIEKKSTDIRSFHQHEANPAIAANNRVHN
jgi:hypothetical protein